MYKKIFIDFDRVFETKKPSNDIIVLTNIYSNDWVENIKENNDFRNEIYKEFESFIERFEVKSILKNKEFQMTLFNNFCYPLGQWITKIEQLKNENKIDLNTEVEFSSYSSNSKVFLIEAEGETNGGFLYKENFYLPYYINKYFKNKGFFKTKSFKKYKFKVTILYYIRIFIFVHALIFKQFFYWVLVRKRKYNLDDFGSNDFIVFTSRGIVQSQFISGFYKENKNKSLMIINELSMKPFVNLEFSKKKFDSFFYAEGYLSFKYLIKEYFLFIKKIFVEEIKEAPSCFYGVKVSSGQFIKELELLNVKYRLYGQSVKNGLNKFKEEGRRIRKVLSFDMLDPYPYFLKSNAIEVNQIQTTLMSSIRYPSFVYGEKFFFTSQKVYEKHAEINREDYLKYDLLNNLKYFELSKKKKIKEVKKIIYFCQPIYLEEEKKIIKFLQSFSTLNNICFYVKLHPRSTVPDFIGKEKIIEGKADSLTAMLEADLVVTRNSSIGLDAWYTNTPVLFFTYGVLTSNGVDYIPDNYLGNIKNEIIKDKLDVDYLKRIIENFYAHELHGDLNINKKEINNKIFK